MGIFNTRKGMHVWPRRTICEVHRELYDLCITELTPEQRSQFVPRLEEAYAMGIKLVATMIDRKLALPNWEKQNVTEAGKLRQARIEMEKTLESCHSL